MRPIIIYIAMSLDGYIADINGGVTWLEGDGSGTASMDSFFSFYETIDTVVLGWKTYHQIMTELSPEEWPYKGKQSYVFTHHKETDKQDIKFMNDDIIDSLDRWKTQPGKGIWICGGANIINQLLHAGKFDRLHISIIPIILGDGLPLFDKGKQDIPLKLIHSDSSNGITELIYEKQQQK